MKNKKSPTELGQIKSFEKNSKGSQKGHSNGSKMPAGPLCIDSWSAFSEYVRYAPELVGTISGSPVEIDKAMALWSPEAGGKPNLRPSDKFSVEIKIKRMSEDDFLAAAKDLSHDTLVIVDHITDTRNLGAIARSLAFFGGKHLVMPKDRQAPITSATLTTAQGAFAIVTPIEVVNLPRFIRKLKDVGYWILAADMNGAPIESMQQKYEKIALVVGSEDKGVSRAVSQEADLVISIQPRQNGLESLNVSVATGVLLHALSPKG